MNLLEGVSESLGRVPLDQLLLRSLDRRLTGALVLTDEDGAESVVELLGGLPGRVLVPDEHARLGEILLDRGYVTAEELAAALALPGSLLGEALVAVGAADEATIKRALVVQVLNRMSRLFGLPSAATWCFFANDARFAGMPPGARVDPLRALAAGLTAHEPDPRRVDAVLALLADAPLVLRSDARVDRFGFQGDSLAVATLILAKQPTFEGLLASAVAAPHACRRVVYLLAATRFLQQGERARTAPLPTPSSPGLPSTDGDDPPSTLGPRRLSRLQLKRVAVSRVEAPDSASGPADDALLGDMSAVDAPPTAPASAPASAPAPNSSVAPPESALSTAELHDRIAYHLGRAEPQQAHVLCELATQRDPDDLAARSHGLWTRSLLPRPDLKVLTLELDDILLVVPELVAARHYRGMLRRRLGQEPAARQDFERVLLLEPSHGGARAQLAEIMAPLSSTRR